MPEPGRVLGVDHGDSRIGLAITDPNRRLAVPAGTISTGAPRDLKAIAALVREKDVTLVVVGLPLSLSGERGPRALQAESFADALRSVLPVPVELIDERLSTIEATKELRSAGARGAEVRAAVDQTAALVILRSWLERQPGHA